MSRLPEIGAYAVLRGTQQFIADSFRVERALGGMNAATSALGAGSVRGFTRASSAAAAFGTAVSTAMTIGTVAMIGAGVAAKNVAADFEESLTFISSITQETGTSVGKLGRDIDELSRQGTFGLRNLGEAGAELARGGLALSDISGGALEAAQNFAIAAREELSLAEASELVATGLQTFNLEADKAHRITDSITGVAQRSTARFNDLATSFRYAAPGAVGLKISVEELSAVLGVLADSGIRGSRAGTALRQVFTTLVDPPKRAAEALEEYGIGAFDAEGKVRPLRDILIDFQKQLGPAAVQQGKLTEAQRQAALATIFTQNAYSAVNAILNRGVQEYDDMLRAIEEVSAAEVAARLLETTNARTKIFQASVESAANAIGTNLLPAFNSLLVSGTALAENFRVAGLALQALTGGSATPLFEDFEKTGFGEDLLPFLDLLVTIGEAIETNVLVPLGSFADAIASFDFSPFLDAIGAAFENIGNAIGIALFAFENIIGPMGNSIGLINEFGEVTQGIELIAKGLEITLTAVGTAAVAIFAAIVIGATAAAGVIVGAAAQITAFRAKVQNFADELLPAFANFADNLGVITQTAISDFGSIFDALGTTVRQFATDLQTEGTTAFTNLFNNIKAISGEGFSALGSTLQNILSLFVQLSDDLGLSIRPLVESIGEAFGRVGEEIGGFFSRVGTEVRKFVDELGTFKDSVFESAQAIGRALAPALEIVLGGMKPLIVIFAVGVIAIAGITKAIIELGQKIVELGGKASESSDEVGGAFDGIGTFIDNALTTAGQIVEEFVNESFKNIRFLADAFGQSFAATGEVVNRLWTELWNNVGTTLANAGKLLGELFTNLWNGLLLVLAEFIEQSTVGIRFFLTSLGNSFASAGKSLNNIWLQVWNGMIGIVREAVNTMAGMINSFLSALASTPVGQFVGGLSAGFAELPGAIGGAIDAAGNKINELGENVNNTITGIQNDINNAAAGVTSAFGNMTSAVGSFNFEMPELEGGTRRAGAAMEDFEASTRGVPPALGGPGGVGRAARGAAKDVITLAEAFDIAANKLRQRVSFIAEFGEVGAKAAAALSDAILLRTPENADKAVDSLFEIIDAMREAGIPNFMDLGDELILAFREAIVDGTPGAVSAALELLQQMATEVGLAGRLTVESFAESFDRVRLSAAIGKEADSVMQALNKAFVDGSKKNRDALSSAALSYLDALRDNFPPEAAAQYGEDVMAALNEAIESGSSETLFAVFNAIAADLSEQGRLTAEGFIRSFNNAAFAAAQGIGAALIDAIARSITEGGAKNIDAIGQTAFSIIEKFHDSLSPESARALTAAFMDELQSTIADGSPEALARFSNFVRDMNQQAEELKVAEKISKEFEKAEEAISSLLKDSAAQRHIENLRDALRISQEIALDIFQTGQEADAINRRRDQEDDDVNRSRKRALEQEEENHQKRLQEIRNRARKRTTALVTLQGGFSKSVGADDEFAEERKRHKERLEELKKEAAQADEDRKRKRDREDEDRAYSKEQETRLREFREGLATEVDKFNRNLENERIKERIANIEKQRDEAIKNLEAENTKARELFEIRFTNLEEVFLDPATEAFDTMLDEALEDLKEFEELLKGLEVTVSVTRNEKAQPTTEAILSPDNPILLKLGRESSGSVSGGFSSGGSFQHGGIVPGVGEKLILAHGGETILPTRIPMSNIRPVPANVNNSTHVNNLTVNANYAKTQSPVQVRQDMSALIALIGGR